jgi:N-methylhydantoinase A
VERGHDPRRFTLVAFGGGGPVHAVAVARALRVPKVLVPAMPGALSAVGILLADAVRDYSRTVMLPGERMEVLEAEFAAMEALGLADMGADCVAERSVDLRYRGQGYELNVSHGVDAAERFHAMHAQRYGFANRQRALEIVNVRLRVRVPAEPYAPVAEEMVPGDGTQALRCERAVYFDGAWVQTRVYDRELLRPGDALAGPALVAEYTSVTVLPPGAQLEVDGLRNLVIEVEGAR